MAELDVEPVLWPGLARFSHPGKYRAVITGNYRPGKNLK